MTSTPVETDDELLLRTQSGDEDAFLTLYRRRQAGLFRFVLHMSGSKPLAEDVTQEVFLALLRQGCGYVPGCGTWSAGGRTWHWTPIRMISAGRNWRFWTTRCWI